MRNTDVLNKIRTYKRHVKMAFDVEQARQVLAATLPPALGLGATGILIGALFDRKHGILSGLSATLGAVGAAIGAGIGLYGMGKEVKLDAKKDISDSDSSRLVGRLEGVVSGLERAVTRTLPGSDSRTSDVVDWLASLVSWFDPPTLAAAGGIIGGGSAATKPTWAPLFNPEIPELEKAKIRGFVRAPRYSDLTEALRDIRDELQRNPAPRRAAMLRNRLQSLTNIGSSAGVLPRFSIGQIGLTGKNVLRRGLSGAKWGFLASLIGHLLTPPREQ